MTKNFYESICIYCNRMDWDHNPICPEYVPPWEREKQPIEPKTIARLADTLNQTKAEVVGWREKHSKALLEIDILKTKVDRGTNRYKYK